MNHLFGINTSVLRYKVLRKLKEVGIFGTIIIAAHNLIYGIINILPVKNTEIHIFDQKYGTDTSGIIKSWALDIPYDKAVHAKHYQAVGFIEDFINILNNLNIQFEEFIFIDLGSGKGRALLLASHFPFNEIIGIELSQKLHDIACNNIKIYINETQKCHRILSVCEDAACYKIPLEHTVFYFYNPFDEHIMKAVLSNIEDSIRKYPREIYIIYHNPVYREVFDVATFLKIYVATERHIIYKCKTCH